MHQHLWIANLCSPGNLASHYPPIKIQRNKETGFLSRQHINLQSYSKLLEFPMNLRKVSSQMLKLWNIWQASPTHKELIFRVCILVQPKMQLTSFQKLSNLTLILESLSTNALHILSLKRSVGLRKKASKVKQLYWSLKNLISIKIC